MREILEDVASHIDDPVRLAQKHAAPELPRRFYKVAAATPVEGGFAVILDGRPTRTPGRGHVVVPALGIAEAMAREWNQQGEFVDPQSMPTVRLVNSALESGEAMAPRFREEIVKFAGNDLLLYRAESPRELVELQERLWDDVLVKLARRFAISFQPTIGIVHQPQPEATLSRLAMAIEPEGLFALTALVSITGLTGSGLLAIALRQQLLAPDQAWLAAHVDEDYQASLWGTIEEATVRRARRRAEFDAAVALIGHLG